MVKRWQIVGAIYGSNYYRIVDGPTWTQAEANSLSLGGHLVTVNNREEGDFLVSTFGKERYSAFIGLNDIEKGSLQWQIF